MSFRRYPRFTSKAIGRNQQSLLPMKPDSIFAPRRVLQIATVLVGAAFGLARSSSASTTAYTLGTGGWSGSTGSFVVGFEFSISAPISITHLGILDWFNNGISGTP